MKVIERTEKLCFSCMEKHYVDIVEVTENEMFKNELVDFKAIYEYCSNTEEFTQTEEMMQINDLAFKNAYRKKMHLLTSDDLIAIRKKYKVSQKDLSEILAWGQATIARYEKHQVQDRAHDDILRKIDNDPKWFLYFLERARQSISPKAYNKYLLHAKELFRAKSNLYLADAIYAIYADLDNDYLTTGNCELDLDKVIETINYLAKHVVSLYKVKLMKMLWYSDILHFKRHGFSITGLAYRALPLGAVPEGYEQIVLLNGVCFDEVLVGENMGYKFKPSSNIETSKLNSDEIRTINSIIAKFGDMKTDDIVKNMHEENAYRYTDSNCIISYKYAENLSIE